ncbi:FMRF-amide neuropeptides-like [Uloborus diversus]|uniref:FMRF-amide neuropeptides-like n=1 Tax=Uloborus diversus TaxID=327109 RepID=UPI0024096604|nr:FMRF-amide neuropeptides-like [Uloborus diversus]
MAFTDCILLAIAIAVIFENQVHCDGPSSDADKTDSSSIPILASGKRQHNIMRFGKRPAGGHNLIHFGKRDSEPPKAPQHSFLYFGKRDEDKIGIPNLLHYLQNNRDSSYKRGHTIMRFGKRGGEKNHNFIRFGRGSENDYDDYYPDEEEMDDEKRDGHSMLYFGKRDGHSMLYFGKRNGHNMLSFGKRDDDKRAHSMIHFGKRESDDDIDIYPEDDKRAHSMIHFGKREFDSEPDELKRGSHSMIHFGKREYPEGYLPYFWNPEVSEKRQHNLLRFGKKTEGSRKGSHAMIHFGKRDEEVDKRAHAMIHFGKRSVDQNILLSNQSNSDEPPKALARMKRQTSPSSDHLGSIDHYDISEETDEVPEEEASRHAILESQGMFYHPEDVVETVYYPEEDPGVLPSFGDYGPPDKKDPSKNVFLRFG